MLRRDIRIDERTLQAVDNNHMVRAASSYVYTHQACNGKMRNRARDVAETERDSLFRCHHTSDSAPPPRRWGPGWAPNHWNVGSPLRLFGTPLLRPGHSL